jgi:beta-lactamase class A
MSFHRPRDGGGQIVLLRRGRFMIKRRELLAGSVALGAYLATQSHGSNAAAHRDTVEKLRRLERGDARLGVFLLDTATGETSGNRIDEHFAMCSTFKLAMVAACLREADAGRLNLAEIIPYSKSDLLEWSPVTGENLAKGGLSVAELAQAAQTISDGTAANLLVKRLGGPQSVTAKIRAMGDTVTRLDRYEPALGMVLSADLRDTTTPQAMGRLIARVATGDLLKPSSRDMLIKWMIETTTGAKRLRAGFPSGWKAGNKTGTGRATGTTNKCNDVAIVFPPGKAPVVVAAYYDSAEFTPQIEDRHQAVLAEVGRIAAEWTMSA